ncbi:hypothetical protein HDU84_004109 [Entophlyctis sp. JEL0112]|nr:hypothetical protein HDU84_004109 [Entophlyctis sp. JEL0112]
MTYFCTYVKYIALFEVLGSQPSTHQLALVFATTDLAALTATLESNRLSTLTVVQSSSRTKAVDGSFKLTSSPKVVTTSSLSLSFASLKASDPDPFLLTFVNPCRCAFGGRCICGDLNVKKSKAKSSSPSSNVASSSAGPTSGSLSLLPTQGQAVTGLNFASDLRIPSLNVGTSVDIANNGALASKPLRPLKDQNSNQTFGDDRSHGVVQVGQHNPSSGSGTTYVGKGRPGADEDAILVTALLGLKSSSGSDGGRHGSVTSGEGDGDGCSAPESTDDGDSVLGANEGCGCGCKCAGARGASTDKGDVTQTLGGNGGGSWNGAEGRGDAKKGCGGGAGTGMGCR